jgi:2,4-diaminopentanoate dehydrogenase
MTSIERCRVAVWGPGRLGTEVIRTLAGVESVDLVSVLAYNKDKAGRDAGELAGIGPLGVPVITDLAEMLAARPDVVVHANMDMGGWQADDDLLQLLDAGCNVITAHAYGGLHLREGDAFERFQSHALAGGATFYCTGVNPAFELEQLLQTLTGACSHIESILVRDVMAIDEAGAMALELMGFGKPLDTKLSDHLRLWVGQYLEPSMRVTAELLGKPLDRIAFSSHLSPAARSVELASMTVDEGTCASIALRYDGYSGDDMFISVEGLYYVGAEQRPADAVAAEYVVMEIEGRPSMRVTLDLKASLRKGLERYPDSPDTPIIYTAAAAPIVQAIPLVMAAPAGVMRTPQSPTHYDARFFR